MATKSVKGYSQTTSAQGFGYRQPDTEGMSENKGSHSKSAGGRDAGTNKTGNKGK